MSIFYYAYHHVYNRDGKSKLIGEHNYGPLALKGELLEEFESDMKEIVEFETSAINNGELIYLGPLIETYQINNNTHTLNVGRKFHFPNCTYKTRKTFLHPHYFKWEKVMRADPNVVVIEAIWKNE